MKNKKPKNIIIPNPQKEENVSTRTKREKRILPKCHFSLLEKLFTVRFIVGTKFHYGPKNTPNVLPYLIGTRETSSLVNISFLITQIRKTLSMVYLNSYHRGMTVISGLSLKRYAGIGTKYFYFFSPWYNGFLTNFSTVIRHALLDRILNTSHPRHVSLDIINARRIPQLPSYIIALHLQHWCCNEASSIRIPQTISIDPNLPITPYHATYTLAFNNSTVPSVIIMLLAREAILLGKMDDQLFFINHKRLRKRKKLEI
jgi:ribosomal protein S2